MLVLDLGGQYSQLIARRVREARVYSELVPHGLTAEEARARNPLALDPLGRARVRVRRGRAAGRSGALRARHPDARHLLRHAADGAGARRRASTGPASRSSARPSCGAEEGALFAGLPAEQTVWMSHRDSVAAPPTGARVVAGSPSTPIAAFEEPRAALYGVQFHPEVATRRTGRTC